MSYPIWGPNLEGEKTIIFYPISLILFLYLKSYSSNLKSEKIWFWFISCDSPQVLRGMFLSYARVSETGFLTGDHVRLSRLRHAPLHA